MDLKRIHDLGQPRCARANIYIWTFKLSFERIAVIDNGFRKFKFRPPPKQLQYYILRKNKQLRGPGGVVSFRVDRYVPLEKLWRTRFYRIFFARNPVLPEQVTRFYGTKSLSFAQFRPINPFLPLLWQISYPLLGDFFPKKPARTGGTSLSPGLRGCLKKVVAYKK